jgi:hypothetical protein
MTTPIDYPALQTAAAGAARRSQTLHFRLLLIQLALFAVASSEGIGIRALTGGRPVPVVVACILAAGLLLMWLMRVRRYDEQWFACRAIAESVKTAAWRYMMSVPPYDQRLPGVAERRFLGTLRAIEQSHRETIASLPVTGGDSAEISSSMTAIRTAPWQERKQLYVTDRLEDQRRWYERRSMTNRRSAARWWWCVAAAETLGLVAAIVHAAGVVPAVSVVSVLTTLQGAFVAWTEAKRHDELGASYDLAVRELTLLASAEAVEASEPSGFERWVLDVEDVLSREHGLWLARREATAELAAEEDGGLVAS